jgi:hypothetical protein
VLGAFAACGSRTGLGVTIDQPIEGADASVDAHSDAPFEAGADVVVITDAGCQSDSECQQNVACVLDRCDPDLHVCTRTPRDSMCDDGVFCNGAERCDLTLGCAPSPPPNCIDAINCTVDACDESAKACVHKPDDTLCPISHVCDPILGCQAHALAHDATTLYDVRIPSGQVKVIGPTNASLTDIALSPSNILYGIDFNALFKVDLNLGFATFAKTTNSGFLNAADFAPDGTLYVAGGTSLFTLDINSGIVTSIMTFPSSTSSSGDLAFVGNRLLATANVGNVDSLVEFDLAKKTAKSLGVTGYSCIWGLAAYGQLLYGLTCEGRILTLDTTTGAGTQVNKVATMFRGASAR